MLSSLFLFYLILLLFSVVYLLYPLVKAETSFLNFFEDSSAKKNTKKEKTAPKKVASAPAKKSSAEKTTGNSARVSAKKTTTEKTAAKKTSAAPKAKTGRTVAKTSAKKVASAPVKKSTEKKSSAEKSAGNSTKVSVKKTTASTKKAPAKTQTSAKTDVQKTAAKKSTARKSSVKKNSVKIVLPLFLLFSFSTLHAASLSVDIQNITTQKPAKNVESVAFLELAQGMDVVQEKKNTNGKVDFANLEIKPNTQYMVQVDYRGVLYNQSISDFSTEELEVQIQVSDVTYYYEAIAQAMDYRKIIYVTYQEENLLFNIVTSFQNNSNKTFEEKEGGVYLSLPPDVENLESSVPLGGKNSSQLMWLPLDVRPSQEKNGMVVLPHAIKPGFKIYQTTFSVPYSSKTFAFVLQQEYPTENPVILKLASEGITLKMEEDENWQPTFTDSEEIGKIINLPLNKKMTLLFNGGTTQPVQEQPSGNNAPIEVESPLSKLQKAGFITVSIIIFFLAFFWLKQNTELLSLLWLREEKRLKAEIERTKKLDLPKQEKDAQLNALKEQLKILQKKINEE